MPDLDNYLRWGEIYVMLSHQIKQALDKEFNLHKSKILPKSDEVCRKKSK